MKEDADHLPAIVPIYPLEVAQSDIHTLPVMALNEALISDNIEIIIWICVDIGLELDGLLEEALVMLKGDWLTIRNILYVL